MSNDALMNFLKQLWGQTHGGADVAVQLNIDNRVPTAKPAAGVDASVEWMRKNLNNFDFPDQMFLFFVGGPGGGKSAAAQRVSAGFKLTTEPEPLASRVYEYSTPAGSLRVVNDATIPRADQQVSNLLTDISEAMNQGHHLLVCANRGVITDNLGDNELAETLPQAHGLLRLLQNSGQLSSPRTRPNDKQWEDGNEWSFIRSKLIEFDGTTIRIVAVFLDECSLFEPSPRVEIVDNLPTRKEPYRILTFTTLVNDEKSAPNLAPRLDSPAADLLDKLFEKAPTMPDPTQSPIEANFTNLMSPDLRLAFLNFARGAEIISDRRLTYRDLWASYARVFAGHLPSFQTIEGAAKDVSAELHVANDPNRTAKERWAAVMKLGKLRYFMSIFESSKGLATDELQSDQLAEMFKAADPAADSSVRWEESDGESDIDPEIWRNLVFDAFSVVDAHSSPLDFIKNTLKEDASEPSKVTLTSLSPFEELVDRVFLRVLEVGTDAEKVEATSWYGLYLVRLLHISLGVPAFASSVRLWTRQWTNSWSHNSQILPDLQAGLQALINPPSGDNPESLVATFASRAEALTEAPNVPILVTKLSSTWASTRAEGERLWAEVKTDAGPLGRIRLDLELIRQIQTSVELTQTSSLGLTEKTDLLEPRLERLRASQLGGTGSSDTFVINKTGQRIIFSLMNR